MNPSRAPAGSWTPQSLQFLSLPAALEVLMLAIDRQMLRPGATSASPDLETLRDRLELLQGQQPGRECFEEALTLCHAHGFAQGESYLAFLYAVMRQPLVDFAGGLLRRMNSREDVEVLAVDLVGSLFTEIAEALMDGEDPGSSSRMPPPGRAVPWLFQALRHDVMDHCKSGINRLEKSVEPAGDEGYDQALERLSFALTGGGGERTCGVDLAERQEAFLAAFEYATQNLKPRHREVLRLRELENASVDEIADQLELTRQKVLDLLQYAREKRATLIVSRLKSTPALADLNRRPNEMVALLQRVRLWYLASGLRSHVPRWRSDGRWSREPDPAWVSMNAARQSSGGADARGRRRL